MSLWSMLFGKRRDLAAEYKTATDDYWRRYQAWRDAQTCIGCGEAYKGSTKNWITEYECMPCWMAGVRANASTDTGEQFRRGPSVTVDDARQVTGVAER